MVWERELEAKIQEHKRERRSVQGRRRNVGGYEKVI
jgi:hypothetical protein